MKRAIMLLVIMIALAACANAQHKKMEDVVYLKNESAIRGAIISADSIHVRLQTNDGSILVFSREDILKTEKLPAFGSYHAAAGAFAHYTELGPLVAGKTTIDGVTTAAFSFQTVNGYRFNQYLFTGAGIGIDLYATQTMIPLFASIRGDLSATASIIPFYFIDGGYAVNITQNSATSTDFRGGLLYAGGIGVKIPLNRSAGFLVSFGYRYQTSSYLINNSKTNIDYRRLAIRAGFFL